MNTGTCFNANAHTHTHTNTHTHTHTHQGKVEMDVEIVTEEDSQLRPAAEARDEPNLNPVLEPPK